MDKKEPRHYVASSQNALQIPDLRTAFEVMKLLQINPKGMGLKNKDDAIKVIIEKIGRGVDQEALKRTEPSKGLKKAIEDDQKHKVKLVAKYEAVQRLYNELPNNYKRDLKQVFAGIEENFQSRKSEILKSECTILIVGETAAGKSSLINLLLGVEDLMPTSQLGCTATICELRTNKQGKKEAVAYFRAFVTDDNIRKRSAPVMFDLETDAGRKRFKMAVTDCDEDGNSPYDRIEVTWPFPMLEEGMVIVDTPGIGSGGKMAKYTEQYLSKSYGFIYVINTANAGGVQKGRLQNFMRLVVNAAGEEGFNSESTMFVCNMWDKVPDRDRDAVKHDTFDKLSRFFNDLKRDQIHYMSILDAQKAVSLGTNTNDYGKLLELIENLLPDSLRSRLNVHYRWITAVLKRILYILKVSKVMQAKSMEKVKDEFQQIKIQIEKLEQNSKESINYLKTNISMESEMVTEKAVQMLQSRDVTGKLFDWRFDELPRDDRKKVAAETLDKIANKVAHVMNAWERENNIVAGIKEKIIRVCKRDFELMENQIAKIEGALLDGDSKIVKDLHKSLRTPAPVRQVWSKAKGKSVDEDTGTFKGLGGAIASVCTLKASDKAMKKLFNDYKLKDTAKCTAKMQEATKLFLDSIFANTHLQQKVHKFFSRFVKDIDAVAKMIPDFLKADLELMEILRNELSDTETNLRELFPKLLQDSHSILGQCDVFFVNNIMKFDYELTDLKWDLQTPPVGSGSFADVYIAEIRSSRKGNIPVALKVCRDPLKEHTVSDILLEDRTMRELDHPNVVKYYGATFRFKDARHKKDMQWIMIMEVCKDTMKEKFINPDVENPGKMPPDTRKQKEAMLMMADFAKQLCSGVKYLHDKGFVHRDLKLENILVTERNTVKLTDVGLTKQVADIANSLVGSPVYMAPEVLLQSQNYDHKADIYSLGIIFWEMWYGRDAADYIQQQLFGSLEQAIKNGLRPSLKIPNKAPDGWMELFERSWAYKPEDRPSIDRHFKFFEDYVHDARRM